MTDAPDLSPRQAVDRYLDHRRTEASKSSIKSWRYRLKHFVEWAEETDIESMRALDGWTIDEFENYRRGGGISASTLNTEMQTLKNWLEYLARIEVVDDGIPEKVHVPKIPDGEETNDDMLDHDAARLLLSMYREHPKRRASSKHALMELLWFTGARLGGVRALDLEDYHSDDQFVEFRHRPETGTPLKNDSDGERAVGLPRSVCDVLDEYIATKRNEAYENGRQPLLTTSTGRPGENCVRTWSYLATQPCMYQECPHGENRETCQFVHVHHAGKCPTSVSPHPVRTGSITWQRDQGLPAEIVSKRVNATLEVIEDYYDKATERERLERRRRPYIDHLQFNPENDPDEQP